MIKRGDKLLCIDTDVIYTWQYYQSSGEWNPIKGNTYTVGYVLYADGELKQFSVTEIGTTFINGRSIKCFLTPNEYRKLKIKNILK